LHFPVLHKQQNLHTNRQALYRPKLNFTNDRGNVRIRSHLGAFRYLTLLGWSYDLDHWDHTVCWCSQIVHGSHNDTTVLGVYVVTYTYL